MIKTICRIVLLVGLGYCLGMGIKYYNDGYSYAKKMDKLGNLNLFSACLEVTGCGPIAALGFKSYLRKNTNVMEELEKLHFVK